MAVVLSDAWAARVTAHGYMMLTAMWFAELGKEAWPVDWLETGHVLEE